ncbi:hypothetical protein OZX67_03250 [Bifidobacterium sp. ESL0728]|uniref:hypothetical protein n=1 Tax=Bifidobacterium sp. ESL0728 TaxID=2983220 RepID=UPI0023F6509F|nr:hypothetical protein [Bifidobacterium sp. ESL0728]WEV59574.1 hypothetical protein OZX67_03250 [Bifidobacterium sp. ESL0728]
MVIDIPSLLKFAFLVFFYLLVVYGLSTFEILLWIPPRSSTLHPQHAGTPGIRPQDPFQLENIQSQPAYWNNRGVRFKPFQRWGLDANATGFH